MKHIVGQASRLPRAEGASSLGRFAASAGETPALRWRRVGSGAQGAEKVRRISCPIIRYGFASVASLAVMLPGAASACASCFGQSDSPMAKGMNAGIFTLLLVITSVLVTVAIFFAYILRRAARLRETATRDVEPVPPLAPGAQPASQTTH